MSLVIAKLKELLSFSHRSTLYLLKEQRGLCLFGWRGLFNYCTNQRSSLWPWFFSQLIPQVFTFSKFIFFMISLISSFHLLIQVFWVSFLLNFQLLVSQKKKKNFQLLGMELCVRGFLISKVRRYRKRERETDHKERGFGSIFGIFG